MPQEPAQLWPLSRAKLESHCNKVLLYTNQKSFVSKKIPMKGTHLSDPWYNLIVNDWTQKKEDMVMILHYNQYRYYINLQKTFAKRFPKESDRATIKLVIMNCDKDPQTQTFKKPYFTMGMSLLSSSF